MQRHVGSPFSVTAHSRPAPQNTLAQILDLLLGSSSPWTRAMVTSASASQRFHIVLGSRTREDTGQGGSSELEAKVGASPITRLRGSPTWARRPLRPLLPRPPAPQLLPILLPFCSAAPAAPAALPPPGPRPEPRSLRAPQASPSSPRPPPRILRCLKRRHGVSMSQGSLQQRRGKPRKPTPGRGAGLRRLG